MAVLNRTPLVGTFMHVRPLVTPRCDVHTCLVVFHMHPRDNISASLPPCGSCDGVAASLQVEQ